MMPNLELRTRDELEKAGYQPFNGEALRLDKGDRCKVFLQNLEDSNLYECCYDGLVKYFDGGVRE